MELVDPESVIIGVRTEMLRRTDVLETRDVIVDDGTRDEDDVSIVTCEEFDRDVIDGLDSLS